MAAGTPPPGPLRRFPPEQLLLGAALVTSALVIFWPALAGTWLWDDENLIGLNPALRTFRGLGRIWFSPAGPDYFPLTATVQWVQWHLWGLRVTGYHLTNIGLHALSAWLLWRLLRRLNLPLAWFGALLFLCHPLAVESVAWIAELKNTLALPPLLLSLAAFLDYDEGGRRSDHRRALGWFLAAMLCKTSGVLFPAVLLLHAWWRRGRVGPRDVAVSLPFFLVSFVLGLATWWFQQTRAIGLSPIEAGSLVSRLAASELGLAFYLGKCAWPVGLVPIYPRGHISPASALLFWPWLGFVAVAVLTWSRRISWGKHALFGFGIFALMAAPTLGLVPIAFYLFARVADNFAYLRLVAFAGGAAAGAERRRRGFAPRGSPGCWRDWSRFAPSWRD